MIKLKLHSIAKKLGKNISEISEETGINRNTITALFHGSANGVWFFTLDRLCNRYNLELTDIVEFEPDATETETPKMYRQILTATPMEFWARISAIQKPNPRFFDEGLGSCDIYFQNNNCEIFWHSTAPFQDMASAVFKEYGPMERRFFDLKNAIFDAGKKIENSYIEHFGLLPHAWNFNELLDYFNEQKTIYEKFWSLAILLDSFDVGFDNKEVEKISSVYGFSPNEIGILLTPVELSIKNQRLYELLTFIKKLRPNLKKTKTKNDLQDHLAQMVKKNEAIQKHIAKYSDYGGTLEEKDNNFIKEFLEYFNDEDKWQTEYKNLHGFSKKQKALQTKILARYKINKNPLAFFVELGRWREYRSVVNHKMIQLLDNILDFLSGRLNVDKKYLGYLCFAEVDNVIRNLTPKSVLQKRLQTGMIVSVANGEYKVTEGEAVKSVYEELKEILQQSDLGRAIAGKVGAQGYAQGVARVIEKKSDLSDFQTGEILITKMTTDDMIPAIEKSGAIVCDEGGMTSHAAINARLYSKPCIVGTQTGTKQIHTGDIVVVRAHHGTVRVLESNKH